MPGALSGLRVIDFGQYMAGPMAAMLLGDHGADVIRIDPPGGPRWDTPANATWNRNKRSIVLNLKKRNDRKIAKDLVASADILIENFRPGVMERLGLGYEAMMKANKRLIYCSLPGFGSDDPRANVRAWEGVVGAATSAYKPNPDYGTGRPIYTVIPYGSAYAAFLTAVSVGFALTARDRSGTGQRIEIPMYDASFTAMGARGMKVHRHPEQAPAFNWSRQAECKDGRWVMYVANNTRHPQFLKETGADQWIAAKLSPQELTQKVSELFKSKTALEWEQFCARIGTECVTCHTSAEWHEHPQALGTGILADFEDPVLGRFRGPGINARLSDTPGSVRRPRPLPDQHREEILKELAAGAAPARLKGGEPALRAALEGVKVLDLCIILAGPACGRTLAEFGADVIKIDDPRRNPLRFHFDVNRGKRSVLLDLKTEEGREILYKLIDQSDVVLQNYRKDAAERLGIGYEQVKARKPSIVYASLNTFGQNGPFAGRPGHEQIGQAVSGMQLRYGGSRPLTQPFPANDYGTGLSGAYAVALALLEARRTGRGQHVDTALAYTATMLQSGLMQRFEGKQWNEPHGQDALGSGPLHRAYQAADGWLFLGARPQDLKDSPDLADLAGQSGSELESSLEARMRKRSVADWVILLNNSGIGAHAVVENSEKLMRDLLVVQRGMSITRDHPVAGPVTTTGPSPKLSRTPLVPGHPSTRPGSDAANVLAEIGMADQLERLKAAGVIVTEGIEAGE